MAFCPLEPASLASVGRRVFAAAAAEAAELPTPPGIAEGSARPLEARPAMSAAERGAAAVSTIDGEGDDDDEASSSSFFSSTSSPFSAFSSASASFLALAISSAISFFAFSMFSSFSSASTSSLDRRSLSSGATTTFEKITMLRSSWPCASRERAERDLLIDARKNFRAWSDRIERATSGSRRTALRASATAASSCGEKASTPAASAAATAAAYFLPAVSLATFATSSRCTHSSTRSLSRSAASWSVSEPLATSASAFCL